MENIITYKTTNLFSTPDLVSLFTSVEFVRNRPGSLGLLKFWKMMVGNLKSMIKNE